MTAPHPRRVRAVLLGDDRVYLVLADGEIVPHVPGGHGAREGGGWSDEPVATRKSRPA